MNQRIMNEVCIQGQQLYGVFVMRKWLLEDVRSHCAEPMDVSSRPGCDITMMSHHDSWAMLDAGCYQEEGLQARW